LVAGYWPLLTRPVTRDWNERPATGRSPITTSRPPTTPTTRRARTSPSRRAC